MDEREMLCRGRQKEETQIHNAKTQTQTHMHRKESQSQQSTLTYGVCGLGLVGRVVAKHSTGLLDSRIHRHIGLPARMEMCVHVRLWCVRSGSMSGSINVRGLLDHLCCGV